MTAPRYSIVIPDETRARVAASLQSLRAGKAKPGSLLRHRLKGLDLQSLAESEFLGELVDTKWPQIFAESAVTGDGSDWTLEELGILGDISVAVPVTVFDDGKHFDPTPHDPPFPATLVYTPGALLRNGCGMTPVDLPEVTTPDGELSPEGYYGLYRRRLLPVFRYVNERAGKPRSAVLTIPGLGCGQFAGNFRGRLGAALQSALERFLAEHGAAFPNLKAVYYDPYSECKNARSELHGIAFMVRPLRAEGNADKPQLCRPAAYAEAGDDFSGCSLFSVVAWDHVSWPGNDFYAGSRATDDGVKAAATDSMFALTGVEGSYHRGMAQYRPPAEFPTWGDVVRREGLRLWNPAAVWTPAG
jgi:hypothetical protein